MLTRVLLTLIILMGGVSGALAGEPEIVALGLTDHATSAAEAEKGEALAVPGQKSGGVAYVVVDGLDKGDEVTVRLMNEGKSLMHNVATAETAGGKVFLQAGKTGVPAGGWPEGDYTAKVEIKRGADMLVEKTSEAMKFE
ncbi:hypothetical protein [Methyloligella solikamskensis]|uniref:Uncharacterized protein n=1 Tax=Methyloligella solikamskensis TaxID=1177756 RepID=A0ABW3J870_9HYPH